MSQQQGGAKMADDQYRGLLTDREIEILRGEAEVSENYRYRVVSRVRKKIEKLNRDAQVLAENHRELFDELQNAVSES